MLFTLNTADTRTTQTDNTSTNMLMEMMKIVLEKDSNVFEIKSDISGSG